VYLCGTSGVAESVGARRVRLAAMDRHTRAELRAIGRQLRTTCPRSDHATWSAPDDRPDPVALIEASNRTRLPDLVPVRNGRMLQSPFTFYRGAPAVMASDLSRTPSTASWCRSAATPIS
jgi:hypothetical protein